MENLYIIVTLVLLGYVAFYLSGRKYLETFAAPVTDATANIQRDYPAHGAEGPDKESISYAI
jgi:hypothetical protein